LCSRGYPIGSISAERKFLTPVIENWNTVEGLQCEAKMFTFSLEQSWIYCKDVNFMQTKDEGEKIFENNEVIFGS
jgi:hypothetical protein